MGFNKRHINKEILIEKFKLEGYQGVIDYVGKSDALIDMDDDIQRILDITYCDDCPTKKNIEIKKLINGK
jgi:hypothetical protein|tara:strand:- start:188 stop:397 length:210 start_codon:yes stop_codon:yes gene_type:complete